jgi:hypothetical protein
MTDACQLIHRTHLKKFSIHVCKNYQERKSDRLRANSKVLAPTSYLPVRASMLFLTTGNKSGMLTLATALQHVLEVMSAAMRQFKKTY